MCLRAGRVAGSMVIAVLLAMVAFQPRVARAGADEPPPPGVVTLDADSMKVADVLQILAERSGLNIVTGSEVQGRRVSVHLQATPFEEALTLVVRAAGLGYERLGHGIVVGDLEQMAGSSVGATRVFDLRYADAEAARKVLEVLTKDISADTRGNRLVVRAAPDLMDQVAEVVTQLDRKPGQVELEARLIEVNTTNLQELGIDWQKISKFSTIMTEGNQGTSPPGSFPGQLDYLKPLGSRSYYRQAHAFELAIDALITQGHARLLANSRLVTMDALPAEIFAGQTVPVVITSLQSAAGGTGVMQSVQLEKIDVGVKLRIVPRISGDGTITTLVEPEVSRIVGYRGPDSDLPETSTRRAQTIVRVKDGQKIYLGGLLSEEKRITEKRVPILASIPLLGRLFRHQQVDTAQTDLVIEITPRVVGDEGAAAEPPVLPDK
jgi:type II secretory pathway component GspD/PulD (secretin)